MTLPGRDARDDDAILTDRYLDSLLAGRRPDGDLADARLDPAVREASRRLREDLVRVHPSFRFEETLAARLAEAAAAIRLPAAAGAEGAVVPWRADPRAPAGFDPASLDPFGRDPDGRDLAKPLLIGGAALTSAAISLAGAAFVAWLRTRPSRSGSPMARAARAARAAREAAAAGIAVDSRGLD